MPMAVAENHHGSKRTIRNRANADEFAAYAFDMLQSLREAGRGEKYTFLSYLMGLAAEEAIRLAEGLPSAAASVRPKRRHPAKSPG